MSYILDALRKSDAQRRRGAAPPLLAPQEASTAPARSRVPYYALAAVVLVAAGIVIGSLVSWRDEPPPAVIAAAPAKAPEPSSAAPPAPPPAVPVPAPARRQALPAAKAEPKPRAQQPARQAVATVKKLESRPAAEQAGSAAPQEQKLPAFAELPVALQQEIPALTISAHAYSPVPKERLVGINDRVLREGAEVAPGLVLEQITLEGMVMSYKGQRFRRGAR